MTQTETQNLAHKLADKVNTEIVKFEASDQSGIQAFGAFLRKFIGEGGLGKKETIHHSQVCPHEDNRDGELIIPIAVWVLLLKICRRGWSWLECDKALSCGIPPNANGERWKAKAVELALKSDGLIPPYLPERLCASTGAGSHTTCVWRLLMWAGEAQVKCPDPQYQVLCDEQGFLSREKCVAMAKGSLQEPLDKGLEYFHIRHELVELCPRLMRIDGGWIAHDVRIASPHVGRGGSSNMP